MKGWPEEALGSLVTTRRGCYPSSDAALLTGTLPTPKWILLRILFAHLTRPCSEELSKRWSPWQRADSQNARVRRQQPRRKQTCNLFLMHTKWGAPGRTAKERRGAILQSSSAPPQPFAGKSVTVFLHTPPGADGISQLALEMAYT